MASINIELNAIGIYKRGPEKQIIDEFVKRLLFPFKINEFKNHKSNNAQQVVEQESKLLLDASRKDYMISLDKSGVHISSEDFANMISEMGSISFVIGGSHGLSRQLLNDSHKIISFGKMTLNHMHARIILVEQIYRAQSIINSHPYHK